MRASESEQTGGAGIHEVMAKFERLGWAPHQTEALHDLGTDLVVAVRDERRFELGLGFGAQIKSGSSWFTSVEKDPDDQLVGWWFYEDQPDHFDYWINSFLPHLLNRVSIGDTGDTGNGLAGSVPRLRAGADR